MYQFFIIIGPRPSQPRNVTVTEVSNGFVISWEPPAERHNLVQYYDIKFRTDGAWRTLNKGAKIKPEDTSYFGESTTQICKNCSQSYFEKFQ